MLASIIAVTGTLLGALVAGLLHHRAARHERHATTSREDRQTQLAAITDLAVALTDHRRAMWHVRHAHLTGQTADRVTILRDESHRTRSAITAPAVRVQLLIPDTAVRAAADRAITATYAMRNATDSGVLAASRQTALDRHDELITLTANYLTGGVQ